MVLVKSGLNCEQVSLNMETHSHEKLHFGTKISGLYIEWSQFGVVFITELKCHSVMTFKT